MARDKNIDKSWEATTNKVKERESFSNKTGAATEPASKKVSTSGRPQVGPSSQQGSDRIEDQFDNPQHPQSR